MVATSVGSDVYRIAYLDDRKDVQESVINGLGPFIPDNWELIVCPLAPSTDGYARWIAKNKVAVFLVDQMLNENAPLKGQLPVRYKGHQVISAIRATLPDLPIIVVTYATGDEDLQNHLGDADDILGRSDLLKDKKAYAKRLVRLGRRFVDAHEEELSELSTLSQKAAIKQLSPPDRTRLLALQEKLSLPVTDPLEVDAAIAKLEADVEKLESIKDKISAALKKGKQKKGR